MTRTIIHWFRLDLRLADNPSIYEAAKLGTVLPIYIFDDKNVGNCKMGGASGVWLHHSLKSLNVSLGGSLNIFRGNPLDILLKLAKDYNCTHIHWNRCYEPWRIKRDTHIKEQLQEQGISASSYNSALLWEPWEILKKDGTPYRVFTPFYRKGCLNAIAPRQPLSKPRKLELAEKGKHSLSIDELELLPDIPWHKPLESHWNIGEKGAQKALKKFLKAGVEGYKEGRNYPAKPKTSRLSPHLHYGELSPNQIWYSARQVDENEDIDNFCSELGWREFSYNLLYHNPQMPENNLQPKFDNFPWSTNPSFLKAWQKGQTGYPIIDAGMRELWQTGYMHNRVRMIVGSFLVKNLQIHWKQGFDWFWDCLIDADLANNAASWQWIAGCGADAAPYFRIFNPVTQSKKFDNKGEYIRRWVPELAEMPDKHLHAPYEAPDTILNEAGVTLGGNYPEPIVNLKASREVALSAFKSISDK